MKNGKAVAPDEITIEEKRFGFLPKKSTTDAIFTLRKPVRGGRNATVSISF